MSGSGLCPVCGIPIGDHVSSERKACHDAVSGYRRPYVCPCTVCPTCGHEKDDTPHPEDGLASCPRCNREWWAVSGPHMDGRHIASPDEEREWSAHDDAVYAGTRVEMPSTTRE